MFAGMSTAWIQFSGPEMTIIVNFHNSLYNIIISKEQARARVGHLDLYFRYHAAPAPQ